MIMRVLLVLSLAAPAGSAASAAGPLTSGDISIMLKGGAGAGKAPPASAGPVDMELDFTCRDARWAPTAWGFAPWFNAANHRGQVAKVQQTSGRVRLSIEMTLEGDGSVPGGSAHYDLDLKRTGDDFEGTYAGTFLGRAVGGRAVGRIAPSLVRPVPDFTPLRDGEHPRLIFRRRDLPTLRQRMASEMGKAFAAAISGPPIRHVSQVTDKRTSWVAAGLGVVHQLTGSSAAAETAKRILVNEVVKKPMPLDRADIHHAPRLLGAALAFDLCCDGWDKPFRAEMAEYINDAMVSLYRGVSDGVAMEALVAYPWSHHHAIRMACIGCAAIAILGEKDAAGKVMTDAPALVDQAERAVIKYLQVGLTRSGASCEAPFYKKLALANGVLQFLHAERVARGRDLGGVNPLLLFGDVIEADPAAEQDFGIGDLTVQVSGRWPMGFSSAPPEYLPALRWCFDRVAGPAGKGHLDCSYGYHAAYGLVGYPVDVRPEGPGKLGAAMLGDTASGRYVFRSAWRDSADFLTVLDLGSMSYHGVERDRTWRAGELSISGLGRQWHAGPIGLREANRVLGAETTHYDSDGKTYAVVSADLDKLYLQDMARELRLPRLRPGEEAPPIDPAILKQPDVRRFAFAPGIYRDRKVRARRHLAVDYSRLSGAPALFVLVDKLANAAEEDWSLNLRGRFRSRGTQFALAEESGVNLSGLFVAPPRGRPGRLRGSNEYFVVFTIHSGPAPEIKVEGEGLKAQVRVGRRTIRFDPGPPGRIVLGQ